MNDAAVIASGVGIVARTNVKLLFSIAEPDDTGECPSRNLDHSVS